MRSQKQYQCAQRELLQARERVKMKYNMVSPESNSEKIGSMQSSSVEYLNYYIPKTGGSLPTASHQINNQEPKIKNEYSQVENK